MPSIAHLTAFCEDAGIGILQAEPLAQHTTFHIGGACLAMLNVGNTAQLISAVHFLKAQHMPFRVIGRGSNLLVPDEGYAGVVILLGGVFARQPEITRTRIVCGAGVSLKTLCLAAEAAALTGLEFAYGIPGSVGGAVFMNAGAYDGEISRIITSVTALDENGEIITLSADQLGLGYRKSVFMERDLVILDAAFVLSHGEPSRIRAKMRELLGKRQEKQPLEFPSAGSTFKRPEGSYASLLIDQCGLKGYRVGGAEVSTKHAGFVVNRGGATFADVMAVCAHVQDVVKAQTGFLLELEPEILRT